MVEVVEVGHHANDSCSYTTSANSVSITIVQSVVSDSDATVKNSDKITYSFRQNPDQTFRCVFNSQPGPNEAFDLRPST
jgi:hypothetical protein